MGLRAMVLSATVVGVIACSSSSTVSTTSDGGQQQQQTDGGACPATLQAFKTCATAADCVTTDVPSCCGERQCVGIARASMSDFSACHPTADCRGLGCATTTYCLAEDGAKSPGNASTPVDCVAGKCTSFVASDAGAD